MLAGLQSLKAFDQLAVGLDVHPLAENFPGGTVPGLRFHRLAEQQA
jgi:hypothetical protein